MPRPLLPTSRRPCGGLLQPPRVSGRRKSMANAPVTFLSGNDQSCKQGPKDTLPDVTSSGHCPVPSGTSPRPELGRVWRGVLGAHTLRP